MLTCVSHHHRLAPTRLRLRRLAVLAVVLLAVQPAAAEVRLNTDTTVGGTPELFADGMVLQRDTAAPVWGSAAPGESVSVTIAGQTRTAVTADDGRWRVVLDPLAAGGPYQMTIAGSNTIVLSDVLVGDVWVCAGQSNMVIRRVTRTDLDANPDIRTIGGSDRWYDRPAAVAFAFARDLNAALGVPVGIINRAAGGTPIRSWLAPSVAQDPDPAVQAIVSQWDLFGDQYGHQIQPFTGYAIRGVVYWQGEQDLKISRQDPGDLDHYRILLPALTRSWRSEWQRSDLPFVFVQLPTGGGLQVDQVAAALPPSPPEPDIAARMRGATFNGLAEPNTALAVSIDIDGGVHPRDRELYGHRIADAALGSAYALSFAYSGPIYSSMSIENGNHVRLHFKANTASGLHAVGGPLQGFEISADGQTFVWADALVDGSDVVVWNDTVASPAVVRYGWDRRPTWANLFNDAGLGAAPFSTTETPAP